MNFFITLMIGLVSFSTLRAEASRGERAEYAIIGVNRPLKMRAKDPLPAREFYLDFGTRDGAKVGTTLEVYRTISIADGRTGSSGHPLRILMGEIVLFGVDSTVSWGRVGRVRNPKDLPTLDLASFAIGDEVRTKTSLP